MTVQELDDWWGKKVGVLFYGVCWGLGLVFLIVHPAVSLVLFVIGVIGWGMIRIIRELFPKVGTQTIDEVKREYAKRFP